MTSFGYFGTPSTLQGLVDNYLDCASSQYEGADYQLEKQSAHSEGGPASSIEYLVVKSEVRIIV